MTEKTSACADRRRSGRQKPSLPSVRRPIQPDIGTVCAGTAFVWRISAKLPFLDVAESANVPSGLGRE